MKPGRQSLRLASFVEGGVLLLIGIALFFSDSGWHLRSFLGYILALAGATLLAIGVVKAAVRWKSD